MEMTFGEADKILKSAGITCASHEVFKNARAIIHHTEINTELLEALKVCLRRLECVEEVGHGLSIQESIKELIAKAAKEMGFDLPSGECDNYGNLPGMDDDKSRMIYRQARTMAA